PDDHIREGGGRQVDDALAALADHAEAVVGLGDDAAHERRRELHHRVPPERHDVRPALPPRRDEDDRAGLQVAADLADREITLLGAPGHGPAQVPPTPSLASASGGQPVHSATYV